MRPELEIPVPITDILKILGWSRAKFFRHRIELVNCGGIFYQREGRPPRRKIKAFPTRLRNWIALKTVKGEAV